MKYDPIGTVVARKGGGRPIMIYGRKQVKQSTQTVWDYVACPYPEGNLGEDSTIFFQHNNIEKIFYIGMTCAAEERMQEILNEAG